MTMQMRNYNLIAVIFICFQMMGFGQIDTYEYKRPISNVADSSQWQRIDLPADIYTKTSINLSDLRIYQVLSNNDTLELPYILDRSMAKSKSKKVDFQLLNQSKRSLGASFSFHLDDKDVINEILLHLDNSNFDWKVILEGSNTQKSWSTILDDYRILAIDDPNGEYRFTTLLFPESNFEYYRVTLKTNDEVKFIKATLNLDKPEQYRYIELPIISQLLETNTKEKESIINIDLGHKYKVDQIELDINTEGDYYRPINILIQHDSSLINKKWNYHYRSVYRGTLSSLQTSRFNLSTDLGRKFRIKIKNYDNQALQFGNISIKNRIQSLYSKLSSDDQLFLCYGKSDARSPNYDLKYFKDKIEFNGQSMDLGIETYKPITKNTIEPLFTSKWWLWALLFSLVAGLGWISLKMLREK